MKFSNQSRKDFWIFNLHQITNYLEVNPFTGFRPRSVLRFENTAFWIFTIHDNKTLAATTLLWFKKPKTCRYSLRAGLLNYFSGEAGEENGAEKSFLRPILLAGKNNLVSLLAG